MTATATLDEQRIAGAGGLATWIGPRATFGRSLTFIVAAGGLWRVLYLIFAKADQRLFLNDSLYFSIQAGLNSEGRWFEDGLTGQPGAEHGMLTSLFLTPWSFGAGDDVFRQRFGITLLGIATVAVIGMTGRRLGQTIATGAEAPEARRPLADRVGLVAAAVAAVYPNLWINDSVIMSETIAVLLVSIALYVALGHQVRPTVKSGLVLGLVAGLGALTRSELVLLIPAFAAASAALCRLRRRNAWPALAIAVAGLVTILPWGLWNRARFEDPTFLSTNDGSTLLGANCDITYYDDIGGWDLFCLAPLEPVGPGLPDASERSTDRRGRALVFINDHLDRLPVVVAARLGRLVDLYGLGSLVRLDVGEEKAEWAVWSGIVCWWILAVLAIAGWRTLRRGRVGARWWLLVPWLAIVTTTVVIYGAHRIRAPGEPTVVLLAAVAGATWWQRRRHVSHPRTA